MLKNRLNLIILSGRPT